MKIPVWKLQKIAIGQHKKGRNLICETLYQCSLCSWSGCLRIRIHNFSVYHWQSKIYRISQKNWFARFLFLILKKVLVLDRLLGRAKKSNSYFSKINCNYEVHQGWQNTEIVSPVPWYNHWNGMHNASECSAVQKIEKYSILCTM